MSLYKSDVKSFKRERAENLTSLHKLKPMMVGTAVLRIRDWRKKVTINLNSSAFVGTSDGD